MQDIKINTGVTDWTNTYHGIWTFDEELGYPVSTMRDIGNGSWMYAGFGFDSTINTPTELGLTTGSNYVISWDQWTTNTSKSANCGLYGQNATNTGNGFHDGLSNDKGASAFNTKTHTWQRLYAIFTVSSNRGLNATWSQYNYGHYGGRGVTKVANFQLEVGNIPSKFLYSTSTGVTDSRSTSQAIVDIAGGHTITASNLVYNDATSFSFDGTNSEIATGYTPGTGVAAAGCTIECWYKGTKTARNHLWSWGLGSVNNLDMNFNDGVYALWMYWDGSGSNAIRFTDAQFGDNFFTDSQVHHIVFTHSGSTNIVYFDGVALTPSDTIGTQTFSSTNGTNGQLRIAESPRFAGDVYTTRVYERALTASEVKQNYNASKSKYV
jgi:prepilin-type processing-associated H-X9-DG protein